MLWRFALGSLALLGLGLEVECQRPPTVAEGPIDPRTLYNNNYTIPRMQFPGMQSLWTPAPDCGEESYVGTGRLVGRRALITGGDSGIGRAVAIAYAREGADVVINYLSEEESDAQDVMSVITSTTSSRFFTIPGDLRNETFCNELVNRSAELLGGLDILVSNAGVNFQTPDITSLTTANFTQIVQTNVFAAFFLARAAKPLLRPGSSVIFTGSSIVTQPSGFSAVYAATKAFLHTFSQALGGLWAADGIRVNSVAPSLVLSNFLAIQGTTNEEMRANAERVPLGRLEHPVELAPVYVTLAENAASYVGSQIWAALGGIPGV